MILMRFEQKNSHSAQVEIDEVFAFMRPVTAEVPPHSAVPGGAVLLVSLLLSMGHCVLCVVFLQCLDGTSTESCCISSFVAAFLITAFAFWLHRVALEHRLAGRHGLLRGGGGGWGGVAGEAQTQREMPWVPKPRCISREL